MTISQTWYTLSPEETLTKQGVNIEQGLSTQESQKRLEQFGPNELIERGAKPPWQIFLDQFRETMVIVLIIAAIVSVLVGDLKDMIAILAIVILNAILGFTQEYRAEQAMAALKRLSAPVVKVRRDSHIEKLESRLLVPGDIILLEAGDAIAADCRAVEAANLRVQEASLTGESVPVEKSIENLTGDHIPLGDQHNMLFMGTAVTYGRGIAVVVNTGMSTELGNIANLLQTVASEQTPLQKRMGQLGKSLAWAALGIVGVVFLLGLLRGEDVAEMFLTAVAMAVAAVPEGLPAVVTIALALGAQRMLQRQALIRKLPAVETLGSVTTICSDKTGTLTENRMTVTALDVLGHSQTMEALLEGDFPVVDADVHPDAKPQERSIGLMLKASALCNDALVEKEDPDKDGDYHVIGDPTEGALVVAASKVGMWKPVLDDRWPRVAEIPFSSERKRMTTIHRINISVDDPTDAPWRDAPFVAFCKGSVDGLAEISTQVWAGDSAVPMSSDLHKRILSANEELAQAGQRVLGVAFRPLQEKPEKTDEASLEQKMVFVGLIGMLDPPRPEVKEAVQTARTAGIRPIMITGDHPLTAQRIAQDLGIATDGKVLTGKELNTLSPEALEGMVEEISVYARVSPEHKLRIVQALQRKGHIVAMTGDGVNDAPALRRADIGVAMGITGTDVSKEAADMVILDDNFATIVRAVKEGRNIYDNVRKFIKYTMTSNAGEIYVMLFAPFLGMPLPLSALQILWINLVTDGLPGLALGIEPAERNIMKRPPISINENIFARGMGQHILWIGLLMGAVSLGAGYWGWAANIPTWTTITFTTLTLAQMGHALAIRSDIDSLFKQGIFSNKALLGAVLLTFLLQMLVIYWPPLQEIFETQALNGLELGISLGLSLAVFIAVEIEKWFKRRNLEK